VRLKPFKKEKLNNKQKKILIALSSLAFIFLFIAIYQSFAAYNIKHSETFINAKVGSMYDIRIIGIYIDNKLQANMSEFPKDKRFLRVRCYVNGEFQESITGEWIDNQLTIKGFKGKTDCNVYFSSASSDVLREAITLDNGGLTAIRNRTTNPATAPDFSKQAISQRLFDTIPVGGGAITNHDGKHTTSITYGPRANYQPHAPGDVLFATRANAYTGGGANGLFNSQHDNFGESLYFRGDVRNNFVQFAGFWWRIIRIEGNGNIRLIYHGVVSENNQPPWLNTPAGQSSFNPASNNHRFAGFMYGTSCTTYAECHNNALPSTMLTSLNTWYTNNIANKGTEITSKIARNTIFCNDRNVNDTSLAAVMFYGGHLRRNERPTLQCINQTGLLPQNNDQFSVPNSETDSNRRGNQLLTNPIGLITADEAYFAGLRWDLASGDHFLFSLTFILTMSPNHFFPAATPPTAGMIVLGNGMISWFPSTSSQTFLPVISIRSDIQISGGNGTREFPYIID